MTITKGQRAELRTKAQHMIDCERDPMRGMWTVARDAFRDATTPETIVTLLDALDAAERERDDAEKYRPDRDYHLARANYAEATLEATRSEAAAFLGIAEKAERERDEARADIARIASTALEPITLPNGMPPLVDRIVGAIEQICRERTDAMSGEYIAIVEVERLRALVPDECTIVVIDGAVSIAARRGDCRQLEVASVANWLARVDAAKKAGE